MNGQKFVAVVAMCTSALLLWISAAGAQSPSPSGTGVVPDDDLTLVVGTRFVGPSNDASTTAKAQFDGARIPLSTFNQTDHCVDDRALKAAQEYFETLGRVMGKAGHYYVVPDTDIGTFVDECEQSHARPPQAWVEGKTKIIAFGKVVPTTEAPALEMSVR